MRSRRLINASHGRKFTDIRLTASEWGGTQARQKLFPPSNASWVRRKHDATIEGRAPWAIPWPCVHEFLAVATHPRIYDPPTSLPKALDQVSAWLESPSLTLLAEGLGHADRLRKVLERSKVTGAQVHDARVAALCLCTMPMRRPRRGRCRERSRSPRARFAILYTSLARMYD